MITTTNSLRNLMMCLAASLSLNSCSETSTNANEINEFTQITFLDEQYENWESTQH